MNDLGPQYSHHLEIVGDNTDFVGKIKILYMVEVVIWHDTGPKIHKTLE